jgi:hypothetical protein
MTHPTEEEFVWQSETELVHVPTGATFFAGSEMTLPRDAGEVLPDGRDYDFDDIAAVAAPLLARRKRTT